MKIRQFGEKGENCDIYVFTEGTMVLEDWRLLEEEFCFLLLNPANDRIRSSDNCAFGKAGRHRKVHLEGLRNLPDHM